MGFRSTFTTSDMGIIDWPDWFRKKYESWAYIPKFGTMSSKKEVKIYFTAEDFEEDIRRAIDWDKIKSKRSFVLVWLHQCGGITRVQIEKDCIKYSEPLEFHKTEGVMHADHCWPGCSDG